MHSLILVEITMICKKCNYNSNFSIKIYDIETKCKYHKEIGQIYTAEQLVPKGLCWELYYSIYANCLALLYSGTPQKMWIRKKGITKIFSECPCNDGVKVEVEVEDNFPFPINKVKEIAEEVCKCIYRPLDGHFRNVKIKIIEIGECCQKKYKKGDIFIFNTNNKAELCPAGFATCYPYFEYLSEQKKILEKDVELKVHCPDYVGVIYKIKMH